MSGYVNLGLWHEARGYIETFTGETKRECAEYVEQYLRDLEGIDYRVGFHFNIYARYMPNLTGGYSLS